jgi:hypothetical protein
MTQFVSFSIHPTDANTILGGTQDNGSPATSQASTNPQWKNVNAGDGGYNAITPSSPLDWFVSNPDVPPRGLEIDHCSSGINCNTISFANGAVVTSSQLGGDDGGFYFPYILDPQSDHELIVGTCRVWRGGPSTSLGSYIALSNNFEVGGSSVCTGSEVNQVRALAAGGPKANGFSNVIYAGTDGLGPLNTPGPGGSGGRVFVTTNAAAAGAGKTATFADVTLNINPNNYSISSITIDTSDATGQTAYVTVMGFGTSHIWQTTNAGASWNDFTGTGTGALPDAPANSVLVDSTNGTIFVGTDVGVFSSSTTSPAWTEVGPTSGASGFLPNVPVTALRLFSSGGSKRLRVSTYGRGIWENALVVGPDYQISINDSPLILFPGQTRDFDGFVTALNGYSSTVDLSCSGSLVPATCLSTSVTPGNPNPPFALTVENTSVQDFNFNIEGVGTDPATISHTVPVTLRVVDFAVGVPQPASVDIAQGAASQPIALQLGGLGSFTDFINLSCNGLPAGANCNFNPPNPVGLVTSSGFPVTLTVNTSGSTPRGSNNVTIQGDVSGENGPKTQNLDVRVTSGGFNMSITNSALSVVDGRTATYSGTLTALNGYSNSVNINCIGGTIPSTCATVGVTPSASGQPFSLNVSNSVAASLLFNLQAVGTDPVGFTQTLPVSLTVAQDFTLTASAVSQTVTAGQTASYSLTLAPAGNTFNGSISFTCSGLPPLTQCSLPSPVTPGSGPVVANLQGFLYAAWLPLPGLAFVFADFLSGDSRRKRVAMYAAMATVLLLTLLQPACGGGGSGSSGTPQPQPETLASTYTVTVQASSGAQSHTLALTLIVQ